VKPDQAHPPVASRSDAVHVARWEIDSEAVGSIGSTVEAVGTSEVDVEATVFAGSPAEEEQEAKARPAPMHNNTMERRAIS
jgi:hypothetical protein